MFYLIRKHSKDTETGGASDMNHPMEMNRENELEANKLGCKCNEQAPNSSIATTIMGEGPPPGSTHEALCQDSAAKLAAELSEEQPLSRRSDFGGATTTTTTILASDDRTRLPDHLAGKIQIEAPAQATSSYAQQGRPPKRLANNEESSGEALCAISQQRAQLRLDDSLAGQPCVGHDLDGLKRLAQLDSRISAQLGDPSMNNGTTSEEVATNIGFVIKAKRGFSSPTMEAFHNAQAPTFASAPNGLKFGLEGANLGTEGFVESFVRSQRVELGAPSDLNSDEMAQPAASCGLGLTETRPDTPAELQAEFKDAEAKRAPSLHNELSADSVDRNGK